MKIDRKKILNRCGFDQRECYDLAVRLASLNDDNLIEEIKQIKVWHYGKCELGLWADVLDRLDDILANGVTKVGKWTLKLDQPGNEHLVGKIIAILEFTGHLIEHSIYRYLYGSWEHILALFGTSNMDILLALLGLFYNFSKRSNYFSRLDMHNRKIVLERLDSIAENWGGKQHGFGLAECCNVNYMPPSAGTVQFEFTQDAGSCSNSLKDDQTQDIFVKPKCQRRKLTLKQLHIERESPSELMEKLIPKHNITNTSDQMALFARLRLCVYFGKPELRQKLIYTRMQALSILCYTNEVEDKCLSWDIVEELVDVLKLSEREFLGIKACALRTLTAIIHCGKLASCWVNLRNMTGMSSYHGHFPSMMREWIRKLVQGEFNPYAGSVDQQFTTAILSFLYHLACTNEVNSGQGNLVSTGLLDSMRDIIMWHTEETDFISYATRAVRVTDQILLSYPLNGNNNNQKNTINALVERLKFEVDICLKSEIDRVTQKSLALNTQRVGFIKSMLNLIKRLIVDNEWSDTLLTTMEEELPDILRQIFRNYATKFNPQLCLFSMEVITNFVYNQPSSMASIQDRGLTNDILMTLTQNPLPVNRDFLVTLPTLLSALSINIRGINEVKNCKIIPKYIETLTDSRYVTAMRNKRIREMMTPSEAGDTSSCPNHNHPSTPTSYQMSNAMNELSRTNPSTFRPIIYNSIITAFKRVTEIGYRQPASLLPSTTKYVSNKKVTQSKTGTETWKFNVANEGDLMHDEQNTNLIEQRTAASGDMFTEESIRNDPIESMQIASSSLDDADREVRQILEKSAFEDDENIVNSGELDTRSAKRVVCVLTLDSEDDDVYLMDYICNVCKFMERFMSDQQPESGLKNKIYSEEGLTTILNILTIPSLSYDFPTTAACQSLQKIFEYLLSYSTQEDACLLYRLFSKICSPIGKRLLNNLQHPKTHSILLKDYVTRTENHNSHMGETYTKSFWDEHGVCLLHDIVILSSIIAIYDKMTDRIAPNLRQGLLNDLKEGILKHAKLLPYLHWDAMVIMNLLYEDEESCLEDLKRLCINEKWINIDVLEEQPSEHTKTSQSAIKKIFIDNPRSEKIIKRMLQVTQKVASDLTDLLVTVTKFCCVKPDYSYVVRVRYTRASGSVPTGKFKMSLLSSIADYCKQLLEWESPYVANMVEGGSIEQSGQNLLNDIKFLHPMKYNCFSTIHRILTGGDLQKKPFLGFFYAFQINGILKLFFKCANGLLDTINKVKDFKLNVNSERSIKVMLESFLVTVDRMTQIHRIKKELEDCSDKEIKERLNIELYQRTLRAYMLEPISKLFSFSSLDVDLLNNQSQESLMNIIAFLTSYVFDRDIVEVKSLPDMDDNISTKVVDDRERQVSFITELGFSQEVARRALAVSDYDASQAVTVLFNTDFSAALSQEIEAEAVGATGSRRSRANIGSNGSGTIPSTSCQLSSSESTLLNELENDILEIEGKNIEIKKKMKESFHINLMSLQKEKGTDLQIITRIVDILLLTGDIEEFLEKILTTGGYVFLSAGEAQYLTALRQLMENNNGDNICKGTESISDFTGTQSEGLPISGRNIEQSPRGLHILSLLYNKIRFQLTSCFTRNKIIPRLVRMTHQLVICYCATKTTDLIYNTVLQHLTQLWRIIDQYERTSKALRLRSEVIREYSGAKNWFWMDEGKGVWNSLSNQSAINSSYHDGKMRVHYKQLNSNYVVNFVSLTQKNEDTQMEHPIKLLPNKFVGIVKNNLNDYETRIISSVPECLTNEGVVEITNDLIHFITKMYRTDTSIQWDCMQACCSLLLRLCNEYKYISSENLPNFRMVIPSLCVLPHLKNNTPHLITYVMILLRHQFENANIVRQAITKIVDRNLSRTSSYLNRTANFNEKMHKDMFYFVWDSIPLLCHSFKTTLEIFTEKMELPYEGLTSYSVTKIKDKKKKDETPMELDVKQIAVIKFLLENGIRSYVNKSELWNDLFKKSKSLHTIKQSIITPNEYIEHPNLDNPIPITDMMYLISGRDYLMCLMELVLSYPSVGHYLLTMRHLNKPILQYLITIYLQEAMLVLDSIRPKDGTAVGTPGGTSAPTISSTTNIGNNVGGSNNLNAISSGNTNATSNTANLAREQHYFQQLTSLQLLQALLMTARESHEPIIAEIARTLRVRSANQDGDIRNCHIVCLMKLLSELISRSPSFIVKHLVLLMYKHRLPNDLCRLLATVDCSSSTSQHSAVLLDILSVIDSLCKPDRQVHVARRLHQGVKIGNSKMSSGGNLNSKKQSTSMEASEPLPTTSNQVDTLPMEEEAGETNNSRGSVFYVDINAWSRNVGREDIATEVEDMDTTEAGRNGEMEDDFEDEDDDDEELPEDEDENDIYRRDYEGGGGVRLVEEDEDEDEDDEDDDDDDDDGDDDDDDVGGDDDAVEVGVVGGVSVGAGGNTESETDYEDIEELEGSAGSQDGGDSQGEDDEIVIGNDPVGASANVDGETSVSEQLHSEASVTAVVPSTSDGTNINTSTQQQHSQQQMIQSTQGNGVSSTTVNNDIEVDVSRSSLSMQHHHTGAAAPSATDLSTTTFRFSDNLYFVARDFYSGSGTTNTTPQVSLPSTTGSGHLPTDLVGGMMSQQQQRGNGNAPLTSFVHFPPQINSTVPSTWSMLVEGLDDSRFYRHHHHHPTLPVNTSAVNSLFPPSAASNSRLVRLPGNGGASGIMPGRSPLRSIFSMRTNIMSQSQQQSIPSISSPQSATSLWPGFTVDDYMLDSVEADSEMIEMLVRQYNQTPSAWCFLTSCNNGSSNSSSHQQDIPILTNLRRWLVQARMLFGSEITDLVMLARAHLYRNVQRTTPPKEQQQSQPQNLSPPTIAIKDEANVGNVTIPDPVLTDDQSQEQQEMERDESSLRVEAEFQTQDIITPTRSISPPLESMDVTRDVSVPMEFTLPLHELGSEVTATMVTDSVPLLQEENITSADQDENSSAAAVEPGVETELATSTPIPSDSDDVDNLSADQLIAEGIDPSFLEALPVAMRREVILEHRRASRVRQELTAAQLPESLDAATMAELPPNIQEEILTHYRSVGSAANGSGSQNETTNSQNVEQINDGNASEQGATRGDGISSSNFLLSLPTTLRREVLADMDHSQLSLLPMELAEEARQLRNDADEAQLRALQANLISMAATNGSSSSGIGRRRGRPVTAGLSDLLSHMHHSNNSGGSRGRWDQRGVGGAGSGGNNGPNIRYVVFSSAVNAAANSPHHSHHQHNYSGGTNTLASQCPIVGSDGLSAILALLVTSSTAQGAPLLKQLTPSLGRILQNLSYHPQVRSWLCCAILNVLLRISSPNTIYQSSDDNIAGTSNVNTSSKNPLLSSPTNSESSVAFTPMGSCTDISRSSSLHEDTLTHVAASYTASTFRQFPHNNKSIFFHSFERGFTLNDQVFVLLSRTGNKFLKKSTKESQQQSFDITIHESVAAPVAKALIETLSSISSLHSKEFYPNIVEPSIPTTFFQMPPTNFWQNVSWFMNLQSISLEEYCPESVLPAWQPHDYFNHLLCLIRLPLMQTNSNMLERLLNMVHNILKNFFKTQSFVIQNSAANDETNDTLAGDGGTTEVAQSNTTQSNVSINQPIQEENKSNLGLNNIKLKFAKVDSRTLAHLISIICAKENPDPSVTVNPLPSDRCRILSERLLIELAKGNSETKDDIVKFLVSNIDVLLRALSSQMHKVINEVTELTIKEKEQEMVADSSHEEPMSLSGRDNSDPTALSLPSASSVVTVGATSSLFGMDFDQTQQDIGTTHQPHMLFLSRYRSSGVSGFSTSSLANGNNGNGSLPSMSHARQVAAQLPHIASSRLNLESVRPFTESTGDHLNLLDLVSLSHRIDPDALVTFRTGGSGGTGTVLWTLLGQALRQLQQTKEPLDVVLVFQSLIESFLLVHQSTPSEHVEESTIHTENTTSIISEDNTTPNVAHLDQVDPDAFMHCSPQSGYGIGNNYSSNINTLFQFAEQHRSVINHILRRQRSVSDLEQSNFSPLLRCPRLLDFDIKRRYFQARIQQLRNEADARYDEELITVSRTRLFEDSYARLHRKTPDEWKQRFCIKFINEEGQDGGGLLREWYLKMSHEIFNPDYVLFKVSPDGVTYTINPSSYVNNNHLSYFKFVGRFVAKAIFDGKLLNCYFTRAFYKHILGIPVRYTDLEKEDYQFFRGLEYLLENDVNSMFDICEQTFTIQINEFGRMETRELLPSGSQIYVTEQNKRDYVRLVCQQKMTGGIRQQLAHFLEGFYEIIPKQLISIFNEKELELLICGLPDIDLADLRANTVYNKYTVNSPQIQWFWQSLESFDSEDKARFIQFVTGTSKVPLGGFARLEGMNGPTKFQISLASSSTNHLPAAHTCFNSIDLPKYETYEKLRNRLLVAIRECNEGYGMI